MATSTYHLTYEIIDNSTTTPTILESNVTTVWSVFITAGRNYTIAVYTIQQGAGSIQTFQPSFLSSQGGPILSPSIMDTFLDPNLPVCAYNFTAGAGQLYSLNCIPSLPGYVLSPQSSPSIQTSTPQTLPDFYSNIYINGIFSYQDDTSNVNSNVYTGTPYNIEIYPSQPFDGYTITFNPQATPLPLPNTSGSVTNANTSSVTYSISATISKPGYQSKYFSFNITPAPLVATITYTYTGSVGPQTSTVSGSARATFIYDSAATGVTPSAVSVTAATTPLPDPTYYTISTSLITGTVTGTPNSATHSITAVSGASNFAWVNFPDFIINQKTPTVDHWTLNTIVSSVSTPTYNWSGSSVLYDNTKSYTISTFTSNISPINAQNYVVSLTSGTFQTTGSYTFNLTFTGGNYAPTSPSPTLTITSLGDIPTLQEVTNAGNTTDVGITITDPTNSANILILSYVYPGDAFILANNNNNIIIGAGYPGPSWTFSASGLSGSNLTAPFINNYMYTNTISNFGVYTLPLSGTWSNHTITIKLINYVAPDTSGGDTGIYLRIGNDPNYIDFSYCQSSGIYLNGTNQNYVTYHPYTQGKVWLIGAPFTNIPLYKQAAYLGLNFQCITATLLNTNAASQPAYIQATNAGSNNDNISHPNNACTTIINGNSDTFGPFYNLQIILGGGFNVAGTIQISINGYN